MEGQPGQPDYDPHRVTPDGRSPGADNPGIDPVAEQRAALAASDAYADVPVEATVHGKTGDQAFEEEPLPPTNDVLTAALERTDEFGRLPVDEEDWLQRYGTPYRGPHQVRGADEYGAYTRMDYYDRGVCRGESTYRYDDDDPVDRSGKVHPVTGEPVRLDSPRGAKNREQFGLKPYTLGRRDDETVVQAERRWFDLHGTPYSGQVVSIYVDGRGRTILLTERFADGVCYATDSVVAKNARKGERRLLSSKSFDDMYHPLVPDQARREAALAEAQLYESLEAEGPSPAEAIWAIAGRYQAVAAPRDQRRITEATTAQPQVDISEPLISVRLADGPLSLNQTHIAIGHIDPGTGRPAFYPERITAAESAAIRRWVDWSHEQVLAARQEFGREQLRAGNEWWDGDDQVVRGLIQHQQAVLLGSGLAERVVSRSAKLPHLSGLSGHSLDEAASGYLVFMDEAGEGAVLVLHGLINTNNPARRDTHVWIPLSEPLEPGNPAGSYRPNESVITIGEYNRYVYPLLVEVKAAQQRYPDLYWETKPAMIRRPADNT